MAIPANICIAWPSTAASIPAGWTRETALDARYILGAAAGADTDLSTDRGNTTHTHTSPSHTPTQNSHVHNFYAAGGDASTTIFSGTVGGTASDAAHGHNNKNSNATTGTNNGVAITVNATSNDLAYLEVIWLKSDGSPLKFPSGCVAFFASDALPTNWSRINGDKYLKGAAAASDGGGTGGSNTHAHTSPAHTHTQNFHTHAAIASATGNLGTPDGAGIDVTSTTGHTHQVGGQATTPTNQSVTTTINSGSHEPPFTKLNVIQSSADSLPDQIIALWLDTNASIPTDWARYTAMDSRWLKGAAADGESTVTTGGSATHSHTASDCQPIQNPHTHLATDGGAVGTTSSAPGFSAFYATPGHTHAWTIDNATATNNAVGVTINACSSGDAYPKHRTVIYVQFTAPPATRTGVYTSYEVGLFDIGDPENRILSEVGKKIAQGDLRFAPR